VRAAEGHGRAVQVAPIKPALKPTGTQRLKLECDILLSTSAFKFNLRRYSMVTRGELLDPKEAAEILEDTEEECRGFGNLVKVLMPLPGGVPGAGGTGAGFGADPPGVGEVLLRFADLDSARRAQRSLNGRKFADRMVGATFVSEAEFNERDTPLLLP